MKSAWTGGQLKSEFREPFPGCHPKKLKRLLRAEFYLRTA